VSQLIIPNRRNDERGCFGRCILPDIDDGMGGISKGWCGLRGAALGIPFPTEKFVRTIGRDVFEKIG
jgi:hypothetical protein